jgi:hypothetical protein
MRRQRSNRQADWNGHRGTLVALIGAFVTAVDDSRDRRETHGQIIGEGLHGTVSPGGAASSVGHYDGGLTVVSSGHVSGRSGSGTFKRSDGCIGKWTSSKQ